MTKLENEYIGMINFVDGIKKNRWSKLHRKLKHLSKLPQILKETRHVLMRKNEYDKHLKGRERMQTLEVILA